jgi:hypothetical protein
MASPKSGRTRAGIRRDSAGNAELIRINMIRERITSMTELTGMVGFTPISENAFSKRRRIGVELFATVALAVSLVIAATAVSIGMARAQAPLAHAVTRP